MNKPTCKVHGMIQPRAMCGFVIVGLKYCGYTGDCEHKSCEQSEKSAAADSQRTPADKEGAKPLTRCAAARDGDCSHAQCPQLRDGEPRATGRHCPLDNDADKEGA
jgi:hypothetical protein